MPVERTLSLEGVPDLVERILDRGITIVDREVLLSLAGIELFVLEAGATVLSSDTYLQYAEAVGLLPLEGPRHVTEYVSRGEKRDWLRFPWKYIRVVLRTVLRK